MKKLILPLLLLAVVLAAFGSPGIGDSDPPPPPQTSALWGESGELWVPGTSRLRDFTSVGYMSGSVAIPDWPVGVNVTNFGAVPNDGIDDSQAFIAAIAACPNFHAVFVPNGRYTILQQIIPNRNNFVLRGEDMHATVLHCPKNLNEVIIQEIGYDPGNPGRRHTGAPKGFFRVSGGSQRSIENLSFEFREQMKMGHWEHKGADAIYYGDGVVDSWVRNIYIKNADHGVMMGGAQRISFLNMVFDHYIGRPDIIGSTGNVRWAGHIGINMGSAKKCLYHNIEFKGKYFHDFDIINVPSENVVSNVRGVNMSLHHHGQGANKNLYTNVDVGKGDRSLGGLMDSQNQSNETHWRIYGDQTLHPATVPLDTIKNHVFVGYDAGIPTTITDTLWYEAVAPAQLHPQNIYLAQMERLGKPLPQGPPPPSPSQPTGDVIRINPVVNNMVSASSPATVQNPESSTFSPTNDIYLKFDLGQLSLASIARARLRVSSTNFKNAPFVLSASSVNDDSWAEATLTFNNRPAAVAALDSKTIQVDSRAQQLEFDVTSFVQAQWSGDKVVSLVIRKPSGNGFLSSLRSRSSGLAPELIIEQVDSSVPGAPSAPATVKSYSLVGNIQLDWADNPESDVATYNVYRSTTSSGISQYAEPIATGLVTSDFVDIQTKHNEGWDVGMVRADVPYFYRVTAVDKHGYESQSSLEIVGTAKGFASANLPPAFVPGPRVLPGATQYLSYSGTLAGLATDPEGDTMYFSKVDGPEWLWIAANGTLSGTPRLGDGGTFQFTVQVNSLGGGRDEAIVQLTVNPSAPDAPVVLDIVPADAGVQLDWSHGSEGSADFTFTVYRSVVAGGPYTAVASGLTPSNFTDSGLSNGTTYYYVVRANNPSGESPPSLEVSATPVAGLAIMTNFLGGVLSVSTNWDAGLPVSKWGRVNVDATADTAVTLNAWSVLHTGGSLIQSGLNALRLDTGSTWITEGPTATTSTGFRGFTVAGGSSFTLRRGTINTSSGRDWSITGAGSVIKVHGGTINLGRSLLLSSSGRLVVNGGVINGVPGTGDIGVSSNATGTLDFNGGITTIHRIGLAGSNSTLNLGGSTTGSVTATAFTATFGSNSVINFLPGSRMSLRISGADEWAAALWAAADLTYNGQGVASLGSWTSVIAPNGLGPGVRFVYDSVTETLRLLVNPDSDGDAIDDSWEVLNFGSTQAIDGSIDSDGDGTLDYFEYLFGTVPKNAASKGFQVRAEADPAGNSKIFRWEVLPRFVLGTDYKASISTNLGNWNLLQSGDYQLSQDVLGGKTQVELRFTVDPGPKVFFRLQQP
jgi:hypothetical protein